MNVLKDFFPGANVAGEPLHSSTGVYCPKCGNAMVKRDGKLGAFYGCSQYPVCRGTRPVHWDDVGGGEMDSMEAEVMSIFFDSSGAFTDPYDD